MRLVVSLYGTSRHVFEVDAELGADDFAANVLDNVLVVELLVDLDLFLFNIIKSNLSWPYP